MSPVCILTDSAAQFPQIGFPGHDHVRVISYSVEFNGRLYDEGDELRTNDLPQTVNLTHSPRLIAPSPKKFALLFQSLAQYYSEIIVLVSSSKLTQAFENASKAEREVQGRTKVIVIDSMTTSTGLGILVQTAAQYVSQGLSAYEIERSIRSVIPHIYMMICAPYLSYLHFSGFIDEAQAFVGEMLGLMPIFVLEEGQISAVEKVRNLRGLADFMQEFILEFDNLLHIAFIQSVPSITHEVRLIREVVQNNHPSSPFSEHTINLPLATLIGPRSVGLIVVEKSDGSRQG